MKNDHTNRPSRLALVAAVLLLSTACAGVRGPYETNRDKTKKGAGIGAAAGAAVAILDGKTEADEILAGAAIGAAAGAGIGVYLDKQEERIARIPGTSVERVDASTLLVHFEADLLFDVDSAALGASARGAIEELGRVINDFAKTAVIVQGHTDATGTEEHNDLLSERRAKAVGNHLIARGVDPRRIHTVGYGETAPRADNSTEYGRSLNRRVDVMLRARAR